ncbi:gamma carbonic anhydrase family protein [Desulfococcaceae bacterium HSG9]|nr:gamma carbonic anhydrase family protein [Desulfococcaceae bacterium HSG9]
MLLTFKDKTPQIGENVFIAPNATIIGDVEIGDNTSIWYGAVVRGDLAPIRIGVDSNIQDNCTVHTEVDIPTIIGDNVTVGHNAVIHSCTIENNCLIGIGAIILDGAVVKTGSVIAAGAVVKYGQQVGPNCLFAGVPAEFKKKLPDDTAARMKKPSQIYCQLAAEYQRIC